MNPSLNSQPAVNTSNDDLSTDHDEIEEVQLPNISERTWTLFADLRDYGENMVVPLADLTNTPDLVHNTYHAAMPEGPEVLTVVDMLHLYLSDRVVDRIDRSHRFNTVQSDRFIDDLPLTIRRVYCKGKVIVIELLSAQSRKRWWIVNSLRMTGKWAIRPVAVDYPYTRYRIRLLSDNTKGIFNISSISYLDVRNFGTIDYISDVTELNKQIDGLADGFIGDYIISLNEFIARIVRCKSGYLASRLMDQRSICSGIGNYLLSEILYNCALNPWIRCDGLKSDDIFRLYESCVNIITRSYECGGMSMRDYTGITGDDGVYRHRLIVYGQRNKHDPNGCKIVSAHGSHGRTIWWVPDVQKLN